MQLSRMAMAWTMLCCTAFGAERAVVQMEADALPIGRLEATGKRSQLPLMAPTLVRQGSLPGISVIKEDANRNRIVLEKQAGGGDVAMQFEWPNAATPPGRFSLTVRVMIRKVSKGGNLNMIFRSSDGDRVIPRLQITNGGSLSWVTSPDEVERYEESLPEDQFIDLSVQVDYARRKVSLAVNGRELGEALEFGEGRPITHLSISAGDPDRARWIAFEKIAATEEP